MTWDELNNTREIKLLEIPADKAAIIRLINILVEQAVLVTGLLEWDITLEDLKKLEDYSLTRTAENLEAVMPESIKNKLIALEEAREDRL